MNRNQVLNDETKNSIRQAISGTWKNPLNDKVPPEHVLDQIERYVIGLLELPKDVLEKFYKAN